MTPPGDHAYGVRTIVIGQGYGEMRYRPWCECGWVGVDAWDEATASDSAFLHATGRYPEEPAPTVRHRGPAQTDAIFDPGTYER